MLKIENKTLLYRIIYWTNVTKIETKKHFIPDDILDECVGRTEGWEARGDAESFFGIIDNGETSRLCW